MTLGQGWGWGHAQHSFGAAVLWLQGTGGCPLGIAQCRAYKAKHLIPTQASKFPFLSSYIAFSSQADPADVSLSSSHGWDAKNQACKPMEM